MQLKIYSSLARLLAIACLLTACYIAAEHCLHLFANHNYFFAPFADDILDNALFTYPIATGKTSLIHLFDPYIDHRVAIEHIQELVDFTLTNGVQTLQPWRLTILLCATFLAFFSFAIKPNANLTNTAKISLAAALIMFLFADMNINNYVSTMQITWPIIILFALLTFINLAAYCRTVQKTPDAKKAYIYILLTVLCLNITLYTFNIGAILWPIALFILIKNHCFKKHWLLWMSLLVLNYYCYLQHEWVAANFFSYTSHTTLSTSAHRPLEIFYYLSRIISIPFTSHAMTKFSNANLITGLCAMFISGLTLYYFLKKKNWSQTDIIFFGYFVFSCMTLIIICLMRATSGKHSLVEWRFITTGLYFVFALLMALFILPIQNVPLRRFTHTTLSIIICSWLLLHFLPADRHLSGGTYDLGFFNQVFISEATGIPLDDNFLQASKIYQTSGVLAPHLVVNDVNKTYRKGPYSFWAAEYMQHSLNELRDRKTIVNNQAHIYIVYDYRPKNSKGMLLNVTLKNPALDNDWQVLFTDENKNIVGFAISGFYPQSLWAVLTQQTNNTLIWRGAINTQSLAPQSKVYAYTVQKDHDTIYELGSISIPAPLDVQNEPTWVWQNTQHFGLD
jgi:hypothetical protein